MIACDFLVIGSGIAGASIACELAPHARVVVTDQEDRHGYHTSGRSAAMYIQSYGNETVRRLTAASRTFFEAPPAGFTDYPLLDPRGCLTIARQDQGASADALAAEIRAAGGAFHDLSAAQARAMIPALRPEAAWRALYEPDSADIDVNALHQGFLRLARARGAAFRLAAGVERIEAAMGGWRAALADGETVEAAVLVNAAGAWADPVASLAGIHPLGLTPKRRTVILIDPPAGAEISAWPTVLDVGEQFYFKPQSGLLLASPGDATPSPPLDAAPDELDIAVCVERVQAAADIPVKRVARAWAGLRTFAPDSTPVVGFDPSADGFFWFAGQGGFGMQTSPAAARLGAALALGLKVPGDLDDRGLSAEVLSPARFATVD